MVNARSQLFGSQLKKGFKFSQATNFPKWPNGWIPCSLTLFPRRSRSVPKSQNSVSFKIWFSQIISFIQNKSIKSFSQQNIYNTKKT